MATEAASLFISLKADISQAERSLNQIKRELATTERGALGVGRSFAQAGQASASAANDLARTGRQASTAAAGFDRLAGGIQSLVTAYAGMQGVRAIASLAETGAQARRAEAAFTAFSGGVKEATANLRAMREASGGALSEMQAQQQASRLLSMGLAQNANDLERITRIAVNLGTAMGRDVNTSLEEFALLLANQSILRLDTFGISGAQVRERIEELQSSMAGLDRQTAFVMATMEIGEQRLAELEAAGYDAVSGMDALKAALNDVAVEAATTFGPAIDAAAEKAANFITQGLEQGQAQKARVEALRETAEVLEQLGRAEEAAALRQAAIMPGGGGRAGLRPEVIEAQAQATLEAANAQDIYNAILNEGATAADLLSFNVQNTADANAALAAEAAAAAEQEQALADIQAEIASGSANLQSVVDRLLDIRDAGGEAAAEAERLLGIVSASIAAMARVKAMGADGEFSPETRFVKGGTRDWENEAAARRVVTESMIEDTKEWYKNWQTAQRDAARDAGRAARDAERAYEKALRDMERQAEQRFNSIKSAVQGALDLSGQIGQFDKLLDEALPGSRELGPGEIIRRLMSVVNEGAEGGGRQWAEFYANLLGWDPATMNLTNDEIKARAAQLIQDIQSGARLREALNLELTPGLTGRDALKQQARAAFLNQREMASVIEEVSKELEAEGLGLATYIQSSLGEQFGVQFAEADTAGQMVTTVTDGIKTAITNKTADIEAQGQAYGAAFKKGLLAEVAGAGSDLLEAITQRVVSMLTAGAQGAAG